MSVLIFIEQSQGRVKKSSLEAISFGAALATQMGVTATGLLLGPSEQDPASLGNWGISNLLWANVESLKNFDSQVYAKLVSEIMQQTNATHLVLANTVDGKALAPRLSARLNAGLASGVTGLPDETGSYSKPVYGGKAMAKLKVNTIRQIISLAPNSFKAVTGNATASVEQLQVSLPLAHIKVVDRKMASGTVSLSDADLVVSGGRGLKGPENWGMIEELAGLLGAATACSRPVADEHWRPHHEHVGQTGGSIAPTLYFAVGISGAIQHLAGVNRSKVIVVINKDPEAPFFKAADYGIVGDAFEVMPKIIAAVKKLT